MERSDDLGNQSAGRAVVPGKEGVLLKEALAAIAAVTPFTQMQQRCPAKRNILDYLIPIVVYTVSECSTGRASVLDPCNSRYTWTSSEKFSTFVMITSTNRAALQYNLC